MKLPDWLRRMLRERAARVIARREPDFIIGDNYLRRWWIIPRNRFVNVYLHEFRADDDDRALHDHPWASCSILLAGWYFEHVPTFADAPAGETTVLMRAAGDMTWRRPSQAHRIQLGARPTISLFLTGPRVREWGFWCPKGWRHWRKFTAPGDKGQVGRGCGEQ